MITLKHSVNLITEIDEHKMPDDLLKRFINLSEVEMEMLLRQTFISALEGEGFLDVINAGNSWATVKVDE
jgi:ribosomal protein L12E/L44/L45/RPP1/RPP2